MNKDVLTIEQLEKWVKETFEDAFKNRKSEDYPPIGKTEYGYYHIGLGIYGGKAAYELVHGKLDESEESNLEQ